MCWASDRCAASWCSGRRGRAVVARLHPEFNLARRLCPVRLGVVRAERTVFLFEARIAEIEGLKAAIGAFGDQVAQLQMDGLVAVFAAIFRRLARDFSGFFGQCDAPSVLFKVNGPAD